MAKKFVFEQAMARLEEIVNLLERGDAPLEESLNLFQEGAKLMAGCSKALENAQQQVKLLVQTEEGHSESDFPSEED